MKKFFVLLFAISAVSFINSKEYTVGDYYDYFVTLFAELGVKLDCPGFFLDNKEEIIKYYFFAAQKVAIEGFPDKYYAEVGVKISELPGFKTECKNKLPLGKIVESLESPKEQTKEIYKKIFSTQREKDLVSIYANLYNLNLKTKGPDYNGVFESFGKFLAVFLGLGERNPSKYLPIFIDYYN